MYVGVGHVTVDHLDGDRRRAGGSVVYGALAAALRGTPAQIVTCAAEDVEALLPSAPGDAIGTPVELLRTPSATTTAFTNRGTDRAREQTVANVAAPVPPRVVAADGGVVHLGPVAGELEPAWLGCCPDDAVVVLTPQGLIREWPAGGGEVRPRLVDGAWAASLARPLVVVVGAGELLWIRDLGERAVAEGGALIVTDGHRPATVRWSEGPQVVAPRPVTLADDTGAGDVFATVVGLEIAAGAEPPDAVVAAHEAVGDLLPRIHALLR